MKLKNLSMILVLTFTSVLMANPKVEEASVSNEMKSWIQGEKSVVKVKGHASSGQSSCSEFSIQLGTELSYEITCGDYNQSKTLALGTSKKVSVTRRKGFITLTRYGYLLKKPQVSSVNQTTLKVPFVEEIIHLKMNRNGELAFYLESFKVDEFGRIVQNQFIQAHGLIGKKIKISQTQ